MLIEEMDEIYDMYFETTEYVHLNFKEFMNRIFDKTFASEIQEISSDLYTISVKLKNIGNISRNTRYMGRNRKICISII